MEKLCQITSNQRLRKQYSNLNAKYLNRNTKFEYIMNVQCSMYVYISNPKQKQPGYKNRSSIAKGYIISDQILLFLVQVWMKECFNY